MSRCILCSPRSPGFESSPIDVRNPSEAAWPLVGEVRRERPADATASPHPLSTLSGQTASILKSAE